MYFNRKRTRKWMAMALFTGFVSHSAMAQIPNPGGVIPGGAPGGGVPNLGGGTIPGAGGVPNLGGGQVPNLGNRGGVPDVNRGVRNVPQGTPGRVNGQLGPINGANSTAGRVTGEAASTSGAAVSRFRAPQAGTPDYSRDLPVRLDATSIQGLGSNGAVGLTLDTTGRTLRVSQIETDSLAAQAGLQAQDEIVAVNRSWVSSVDGFRNSLASSLGSTGRAWILVNRNGTQQWLNVDADGETRSVLGASYQVQDGRLVVSKIFDGFAAANAGLQVGDRIVNINGNDITSRADLLTQLRSSAGSAVKMTVERNGSTNELTTQLPQIGQTEVAATESIRASVSSMQKITSQLTVSADAAVKGRYEQLDREVGELAAQLSAVGDNAELKAETVQQAQATLTRIDSTVNNLTSSAVGQASQQLQALQSQIAQTRATLQARVTATANMAANSANAAVETTNSVAANVQGRAEGTVEAAATIAANQRAELTRRTQGLADRVAQITQNQTAELGQRLQAVNQRVAALLQNAQQTTAEAQASASAQLQAAADEVSEVRAELESLQAEASAEVSGELSAAVRETAEIRAMMAAMVMTEVNSQSQHLAETQARVQESAKIVVSSVNEVVTDTAATAAVQRDQLIAETRQLQEDIQQIQDATADRVDGIRDRAAVLQTRLMLAAQTAQGQARTQLNAAAGRAAVLRDRLSDLVIAGRMRVENALEVTIDQSVARLETAATLLTEASAGVQAESRARVDAARENLTSAQTLIAETRAEAAATTTQKSQAILGELTEARTSLVAVAREASADVQAGLIEPIAKVDAAVADLASLEVLQNARIGAEVRQTSMLGLEAEVVSGTVTVVSVRTGSVAEKLGLQSGDEIIAVNSQKVSSAAQMMNQMKTASEAGKGSEIQIQRGSRIQTLKLAAGEFKVTSTP